jgi:hypothetical protein
MPALMLLSPSLRLQNASDYLNTINDCYVEPQVLRNLKSVALPTSSCRNSYSDSKKNRKEIPKVLPSANMRKRVSTFKT